MAKMRQRQTIFMRIGILAAFFLLIIGCVNIPIANKSSKSSSASSPASSQVSKETVQDKEPKPLYYDFGDVLLPSEMKLDKKSSFVFQTPGLSAGVLAFRGKVEISSLIAFYESNMAKDNWIPVGSFKSSPRTIMMFQKENRLCVVNISEKNFSTYLEIWVAPKIADLDAGLLK